MKYRVVEQPEPTPGAKFRVLEGGAAPSAIQIPEYQPGAAWNQQPYEFRSMYEQKAEEELAGQFEKQTPFDLAGALYGRPSVNAARAPITADAVSKRAEEMARENNFKPGFGGGAALDENKVTERTIMNAGNPGMMFGSQGVWEPKTFAQSGDELFDVSKPKMGMGEAISKGAVDIAIATPGVKSISAGALNAMGTRNEDGSPKTAADLGGEWDAEAAKALRDRPMSFRGGQFGAVIAGTPMKALYEGTANALPRLVAPSIRAASGPAAKLGGRVAAHSVAGATDWALLSAMTEPQNRAREEGGRSADVTMGDRLGEFGNQMNPLKNPINYAFGPATLAASRIGHAAVNTPRASIEASRAAGGPRIAIGQATPKAVQARQALEPKGIPSFGEARDSYARSLREDGAGTNQTVLKALENTPILKKFVTEGDNGVALPEGMSQDRFDAIKHVLKRGLDPDQVEQYVNLYNYSKAGSVEEALGLLSNSSKIDSLNVALANIPGDAQGAWRDFFEVFKEGSPEVIQRYLRQATGIDAADYAGYVKGLREKRFSEPAPLYEAAAGKQIAPETWENQILPALLRYDGAPKTIREAAGETASLGKPGTAEAAQELYRFADELDAIRKQAADSGFAGGLLPSGSLSELSQSAGSQIATPRQLSSRALIELDKFLGGKAQTLGRTEPQLAGSVRNTQNEIRGTGRTTGLDPETGANLGRDVSQKYKVAEEATKFGYDSFKNGKTLRSLVDDFRLTNKEEIDSLAQASILMGWVRAAEDQIENSGNASQVITRLYGSANQRKKLLEMLPKAAEDATPAEKSAITRQTKAMMGGKVDGYKDPLPSIFERQRNVLKAEKRMTGGSPTTPKGTAILGESELSGLIDGVINTVLNPKRAVQEGARKLAHTVWKPTIMKEGVNRELGNILTTTGAKDIKKTLTEIRQVRDMRSGGRSNPMNKALATGAGKAAKPKATTAPPNAGPKPGSGKLTPEEIAMLLGKDEPPVSGAGWTGKRPVGFNDELPRGTDRFSDPRLKPDQNKRVEMGRNGFSNAEVGEEFGMSANAVSVEFTNIRRDFGIEIPFGRMGPEAVVSTKILSLAEKGLKPKVIAERLGITPVQARVTLSRARKAVKDAGRDLPEWLKPQTAGIDVGSEVSQFGVGTGLGAQGAQDLDGDGKISFAERAAGAAAGYGVIKGGVRLSRNGGRVGPRSANRGVRSQSFVGINSKDPAVIQRLTRAKEMEKAGASREEIWSETMSMKGADGKWRAEIDDSLASVPGYLMAGAKADGRLGEIIKHPDLYKSYPDMADVPTSFDGTQKVRSGRYNPEDAFNDEGLSINSTNADDARSIGLHETQHGIQSREGFARGGSPDEVPVRISGAAAEAHARQIAKWGSVDYDSLSRVQQNKYKKLAADDLREKQRLNGYKNLAGETEARNVQTRRNMDMDQRRERPAWMDEDVAREDQIVRFGGGASESRPPKKRLGRGLDDLANDAPPVRSNPQKKPQSGGALEYQPRTGADWTEAERKAFINSGHEEGLIPIEPPSSFQTIKDARKSMKKLGVDTKAGTKSDYEGGFPVMASLLTAGGVTAGALGILASYLNQKPKSNVPPALAKERASLADKAATAYQKDPNGTEFRNTMIKLQQVDRQIEGADGGEASSEPSAPSYKPRRLSPSPAGVSGDMLKKAEDKLNTGAERAAGYVKERLRTAELPKRPIDLLMESEIKRNKKGQFMRDMETKRKNDALWQRNGYTGYRGRKMTPEELRAQGKGSR